MFGIPLPNLLLFAVVAGFALYKMNLLPSRSTIAGWFSGWRKSAAPAVAVKATRFDTIGLLDKAFEFCDDAAYRKAIRDAINHLYDQHAG